MSINSTYTYIGPFGALYGNKDILSGYWYSMGDLSFGGELLSGRGASLISPH